MLRCPDTQGLPRLWSLGLCILLELLPNFSALLLLEFVAVVQNVSMRQCKLPARLKRKFKDQDPESVICEAGQMKPKQQWRCKGRQRARVQKTAVGMREARSRENLCELQVRKLQVQAFGSHINTIMCSGYKVIRYGAIAFGVFPVFQSCLMKPHLPIFSIPSFCKYRQYRIFTLCYHLFMGLNF